MNRSAIRIPSCEDCTNDNKLFCSLSKSEKGELSDNKGSNYYKKGQAVFYEGNQSHGLYCIYNGKVKLSKLGENGKEQVIRFAKSGDILGYRAIFSNEPYQATATALEDSHICLLSKDKFMSLISQNHKLSWGTMQLLSENLKSAEQHLINIAQKTVKERIAEALIILHSTFGFTADEKTLDIQINRSEIADIAGTTTETAIRTLAQLNKEGAIILNGKRIIIPDLKRLSGIAGIYS